MHAPYTIDTFPGRQIIIDDQYYRYFGGTAYLGLQLDASFQEILIKNIKKYGTNYGASRKSNIQIKIYEEVEAYLAQLTGSPRCLTLSSGYLAGQFVCQYFSTKDYAFFYAPNAHSALYQSSIKPFTTFTALNIALREHLNTNPHKTPVLFLDSIDFSGFNYPAFEGLKALPLDQVIVVADDSHGIGVVGTKGEGVYPILAAFGPKELIVCCSLGKGFGIQAGAIFSTQIRNEQFKNTAFYGGASPASPSAMASLVEAASLYEEKRKKLRSNIALFLSNVKYHGKFSIMPEHPALSYSNKGLTQYLEQKKIVVTSFNYPEKDAGLMSKIIISAAHTSEDIQFLASTVNTYFDTTR